MSRSDEAALLATRPDFPTLTKGVHLISHSLGAVPRQARTYVNQFMDEWENESINAWGQWLPAVRNLGDLVGSVLGVDSGTVAILPNVSTVQSFSSAPALCTMRSASSIARTRSERS